MSETSKPTFSVLPRLLFLAAVDHELAVLLLVEGEAGERRVREQAVVIFEVRGSDYLQSPNI